MRIGSAWPGGEAEVDAWCRRIENLPALFDDQAEAMAFEERLRAMRRHAEGVLEQAGREPLARLSEATVI